MAVVHAPTPRDRACHGDELYSIEQYPPRFFDVFDPATSFVKWAAVAVSDDVGAPPGMDQLLSPAGRYAVFLHRGPAADGPGTYRYIFGDWIPKSGHTVDDRPHLAVMGERYIPDSPDSEEELWIPIRPTNT
ncbi:GyrI-like domain-containing protein [Mycobacterium sp. CPCC 205372]|uniref:GyrI-like domain-containing protein n=1 Tax=Mycobacterium hippophais TaxID=3016340 RepID=A0ABT4Q0B5_9MYCO|nr:GyrI-like domain-containing protein [Mycobacterium hippophais]MCZ8382279.1 GyrI-like domain-containing protein [Mycobacterium hippophais]